jgi:uncharacterized membrane protein
MANVSMWSSTSGGNLDVFCTLLLVIAWLQREKRWSSALFLGLALATKQTSWFLIPFYAILILRQSGLKEALYRLIIAGGLALFINLPFLLWNPQAFITGVLAPIADPMFPMGVGLIGLSITHLLPFLPAIVYDVLEASTMLLMFVWYWRICRKYPGAAMLLAVVPLFFAWRSLPSYFYDAAFPFFILLAAKIGPASNKVEVPSLPIQMEKETRTASLVS